jgi:hypothetical protein
MKAENPVPGYSVPPQKYGIRRQLPFLLLDVLSGDEVLDDS